MLNQGKGFIDSPWVIKFKKEENLDQLEMLMKMRGSNNSYSRA